jgi:phage shock protein A
MGVGSVAMCSPGGGVVLTLHIVGSFAGGVLQGAGVSWQLLAGIPSRAAAAAAAAAAPGASPPPPLPQPWAATLVSSPAELQAALDGRGAELAEQGSALAAVHAECDSLLERNEELEAELARSEARGSAASAAADRPTQPGSAESTIASAR